ncbi:MAG: DUF4157 domain-containing protein [Acidimicrobiales bacterium]
MSRVTTRAIRAAAPTGQVQTAMTVTAVNDPAEIEADRVADQVVSALQSPALTPALAAASSPNLARAEEEEPLQAKRVARAGPEEELQMQRIGRIGAEEEGLVQGKRIARVEDEEVLQGKRVARSGPDEEVLQGKRVARAGPEEELQMQRPVISRGGAVAINDDSGLEHEADVMGEKALGRAAEGPAPAAAVGPEGGALPGDLEARVANSTGGSAMPGPLRQQMEAGFGADFGNVRMHLNSDLAPAMGALAFAVGRDVHFGPGQFNPSSPGGQHLIAHELTHVVQQGQAPARAFDVARKENQTGLPDQLKSGIENLSGSDLSDVKAHSKADKPAQLNALAYAQGTDINVGPGQEKDLPHEAWHVVQQQRAVARNSR